MQHCISAAAVCRSLMAATLSQCTRYSNRNLKPKQNWNWTFNAPTITLSIGKNAFVTCLSRSSLEILLPVTSSHRITKRPRITTTFCDTAHIICTVCDTAHIISTVCDIAHIISTVCDTAHIISTVCDTSHIINTVLQMPSARFVILHISSVQSMIQHTPSLHRLQQWYCMG